jgi:hypothetical protein
MVEHIPVRDARDRLSELLQLGTPYPLQDLPVPDEQLTVPFNNMAYIPIEFSQRGVLYQLFDDDQPVERTAEGTKGSGTPIQAEGDGTTLYLETYKITDDITFKILARKLGSGNRAYLHQTATVKVGLDISLRAWIKDVPTLDPAATDPSAARITDYGTAVEVVVGKSQEGVEYELFTTDDETTPLSEAKVIGTLDDIVLKTKPIHEDTVILIRATKDYEETNKPPDTTYLTVRLPLKVRANTALAVSTQPAIAAFNGTTTLTLASTQRSARYQVFTHRIRDAEFIHQAERAENALVVTVSGEPDVQVTAPPRAALWQTPAGYAPVGEEKPGTGGNLEFAFDALTDDSLFIVQANKTHEVGTTEDGTTITLPSAVQLVQAVVVLVEPNPAQALILKVTLIAGKTDGTLQVSGGQPGVFYHFRRTANGSDIALPAYFHKRDESDTAYNKGLNQLKLEVDFVIPRDYPRNAALDLTRESPPAPLLDTPALNVDSTLHIRAVKAQTRVGVALAQTVKIEQPVNIHLQEPVVDYGALTRILVENSVIGEKYQPMLNGEIFKRALNGDGKTLSFNTDNLQTDTTYDVLIIPTEPSGIALERAVRLLARVRPNARLNVTAASEIVESGSAALLRVEESQRGVSYQLLVNDTPNGVAVAGSGATIELTSEPLSAETTFTVRASRIDAAEITVNLTQQVTVKPPPPPEIIEPVEPVEPAEPIEPSEPPSEPDVS